MLCKVSLELLAAVLSKTRRCWWSWRRECGWGPPSFIVVGFYGTLIPKLIATTLTPAQDLAPVTLYTDAGAAGGLASAWSQMPASLGGDAGGLTPPMQCKEVLPPTTFRHKVEWHCAGGILCVRAAVA